MVDSIILNQKPLDIYTKLKRKKKVNFDISGEDWETAKSLKRILKVFDDEILNVNFIF